MTGARVRGSRRAPARVARGVTAFVALWAGLSLYGAVAVAFGAPWAPVLVLAVVGAALVAAAVTA